MIHVPNYTRRGKNACSSVKKCSTSENRFWNSLLIGSLDTPLCGPCLKWSKTFGIHHWRLGKFYLPSWKNKNENERALRAFKNINFGTDDGILLSPTEEIFSVLTIAIPDIWVWWWFGYVPFELDNFTVNRSYHKWWPLVPLLEFILCFDIRFFT